MFVAAVIVYATCSVHKALQQHTLKKPIASKANANDETVVDIGDDGTAHDLQQKPSLLTRLASKAGLVSDSAHEEKTSASTGLIGNASQTMLTDSETNNADSPADEIMLTDPQSHEPESPHDLPVEASGSTEAVPALQHAQRQLANSHTVASDQKDKKSNRSHVPGRLDRDIAYMLWHSKHKRASQLRRAVPRRSNQQDDAQPANDQQERLKPANDQLDESQALHAADSGGVQLPGEKASLPGAEGNSQRAEGSFSGAARNALGAKGSVHGAEGTMYMNDELLAEQKAAPEVTSKTSNSKTGAQHEKHLPDEVLVEQAKHWAGRYVCVTLGLLLASLQAMCIRINNSCSVMLTARCTYATCFSIQWNISMSSWACYVPLSLHHHLLCRGLTVHSVSLRQCSGKCKAKQGCWSDGVWLLLTQIDRQAATGNVLQAACDSSAAGLRQGMDDLFCASVLSANGMCLRLDRASLHWCLSVHLGQLPGAVFGVRVGGMQHACLFAFATCAVSTQSASRQCRACKLLHTSFLFLVMLSLFPSSCQV